MHAAELKFAPVSAKHTKKKHSSCLLLGGASALISEPHSKYTKISRSVLPAPPGVRCCSNRLLLFFSRWSEVERKKSGMGRYFRIISPRRSLYEEQLLLLWADRLAVRLWCEPHHVLCRPGCFCVVPTAGLACSIPPSILVVFVWHKVDRDHGYLYRHNPFVIFHGLVDCRLLNLRVELLYSTTMSRWVDLITCWNNIIIMLVTMLAFLYHTPGQYEY